MNLHEYQAKELLKSYGLPVQEGIIAKNGDEAAAAFDKMAGNAGAVVVTYNGKDMGKLGETGEVVEKNFTKDSAEDEK